MVQLLICITLGILVGCCDFFSYTTKKWLNHGATGALFIMLWCLGAKIGCDPELLDNLAVLGGKSVIISLFVIGGSVLLLFVVAKLFQHLLHQEMEEGDGQ
ncbi:MAG: LysO family transporter [Acidaminococcaceae bacterium]